LLAKALVLGEPLATKMNDATLPDLDKMNPVYRFFHNLARFLFWVGFRAKIHNREILDAYKHEGALLACNHVSYLDPPLVGVACRHTIYFLARKTLFRFKFSGWLFPRLHAIPVDQERPDMASLRRIIKLVKANRQVVVFPEGERTLDGKIKTAAPGMGLVISKSKAMVIPMRIFGAYEAMPRGRSTIIRFHQVQLVIGRPFRFTDAELAAASGREGYQTLVDRVMDEIAKIELPEPE
jgi:1-acyl-sn-glycerol-3-phosphate acyltransferase